jgi:hypothetical protein
LTSYEQKTNEIANKILLAGGDISKFNLSRNDYLTQIYSARSFLQSADIGAVYDELRDIKNALDLVEKDFQGEEFFGRLVSLFNLFRNKYQQALQGYQDSAIWALIDASSRFSITLENFEAQTQLTISKLLPQAEYDHSELEQLSLFLNSDYLYAEVVEKLEAIRQIYSEVCQLLEISETDFPLRVIKIETGSLHIGILGNSEVIKFLTSCIRDVVDFFYRKHTSEGKLAEIPKNAQAIEAVLHLQQKLDEAGIDTTEMKEQLQKSGITLGHRLNYLFSGESKVTVNGKQFLTSAEHEKQYLTAARQHLLEGASETDSDDK